MVRTRRGRGGGPARGGAAGRRGVRPRDAAGGGAARGGRGGGWGDDRARGPRALGGRGARGAPAKGPPPQAREVEAVEVLPADRPRPAPEEVVPVAEEDAQACRIPRGLDEGPEPAAERDVPSIAGRGANRGEGEGLHERAEKAGARTDIGIEEHDDIVRGRPPREPPEESKGLAADT